MVAVLTPEQRAVGLEEARRRGKISWAHTAAILEDVQRQYCPKRKRRAPSNHMTDLRKRWAL